jgi:DNA-binding CsgD family transcriptional regulator
VNARNGSPNLTLILFLVFAGITILQIADVIMDQPMNWLSLHIVVELGIIILSLGTALYLGFGWYHSLESVDRLEHQLAERQAERDAWQASAERQLDGLSQAIMSQFENWGLTDAERDTALMVLKGYSHKKIAKMTTRSERTVRQHAVAVYRKSGLAGRAELAAFFLEGLPGPGLSSTESPDPTSASPD